MADCATWLNSQPMRIARMAGTDCCTRKPLSLRAAKYPTDAGPHDDARSASPQGRYRTISACLAPTLDSARQRQRRASGRSQYGRMRREPANRACVAPAHQVGADRQSLRGFVAAQPQTVDRYQTGGRRPVDQPQSGGVANHRDGVGPRRVRQVVQDLWVEAHRGLFPRPHGAAGVERQVRRDALRTTGQRVAADLQPALGDVLGYRMLRVARREQHELAQHGLQHHPGGEPVARGLARQQLAQQPVWIIGYAAEDLAQRATLGPVRRHLTVPQYPPFAIQFVNAIPGCNAHAATVPSRCCRQCCHQPAGCCPPTGTIS
ncbi:protein of unknown function [Micropruina glycogenica]|uniref:Uncharacterized protein n=1 Tax=Micropruina glycogenica TaxID=75385 RepID=A0A2N9JKX0_9ACTN|nr:protein of unknown function [Micropruina glycogenica]